MRKGFVLIFLLICGEVLAQQTENFSGHWVLVKKIPVQPTPGGTTPDIMQSNSNLAATQTAAQDGKTIVTPFGTITMPVRTTPGGTTLDVTQSDNNFAATQTVVQDRKIIVTPFGAITMPVQTTPGGMTLDIMQSGNDFVITQTAALMNGEKTTVESRYTLDGAENVNTKSNAPGPPTTIRSTSSWNNGILTLQGSSTSTGLGGDVVSQWKTEYFLSADRATLTVRRTIPTPFGDAVISQVYGK